MPAAQRIPDQGSLQGSAFSYQRLAFSYHIPAFLLNTQGSRLKISLLTSDSSLLIGRTSRAEPLASKSFFAAGFGTQRISKSSGSICSTNCLTHATF
jgi:hypothetical protein